MRVLAVVAALVLTAPVASPAAGARTKLALRPVDAAPGDSALAAIATRELWRPFEAGAGFDLVSLGRPGSAGDSLDAGRTTGERLRSALERARASGADYLCMAEILFARSLVLSPAIGRPDAENEVRGALLILRTADGCAIADLEAGRKVPSRFGQRERAEALSSAARRVFEELGCRARKTLETTGQVFAMAGASEAVVTLAGLARPAKGARLLVVRPLGRAVNPLTGVMETRPDLEVGELRVSRVEPGRCYARLRGSFRTRSGDLVYGIPGGSCGR